MMYLQQQSSTVPCAWIKDHLVYWLPLSMNLEAQKTIRVNTQNYQGLFFELLLSMNLEAQKTFGANIENYQDLFFDLTVSMNLRA